MESVRLEFPETNIVHRYPLAVRIADMNYGRHLGHDALVSLLHEARAQAFVALGFREWDVAGHPSVVADLAVQYRAEARWPEILEVDTAMQPARRGRLSVHHRLHRPADECTIALARLTLVLLDADTGKPAPLPEAVNEALVAAYPGSGA
jgi:acyl-CoA thioesterase FadM